MSKKKKTKKDKYNSSIEIKNGFVRLGKHYLGHDDRPISYKHKKNN